MGARHVTRALCIAILAVCFAGGAEPAGSVPSVGAASGTYYFSRPDLRLCPSPLCGGAWVRRVNHPSTRCGDGALRRECYVASLSGAGTDASGGRAGGVLVRGRVVPAGIDGFPAIAALRVTGVWRPAGGRPAAGTTFRVADNGVRCVTSPCFSFTAIALEGGRRRTVSDVDLGRVGAAPQDLRRAAAALNGGGLIVTGTVRVAEAGPAGDGRVLRAAQIWLATGP